MVRDIGGIIVKRSLEILEEELQGYYGALNELKMGIATKIPEKPEALILYEQCESLGLPLVFGGVIDQPVIWLQEVMVIKQVQMLFTLANQRSESQNVNEK